MVLADILRGAYRITEKAARPALLGLALAYCGPTVDDDREGCRDDNDCREPRVCVEGECVNLSDLNNRNTNDSNDNKPNITNVVKCSGDYFFEDDFNEKEFERALWSESYFFNRYPFTVNDGVLRISPVGTIMSTNESCCVYNNDAQATCLEARWRINETAKFQLNLYSGGVTERRIGFAHNEQQLECVVDITDTFNFDLQEKEYIKMQRSCNASVGQFHTTRIDVGRGRSRFFLNDRLVAELDSSSQLLNFRAQIVCERAESSSIAPVCEIDYVRLMH